MDHESIVFFLLEAAKDVLEIQYIEYIKLLTFNFFKVNNSFLDRYSQNTLIVHVLNFTLRDTEICDIKFKIYFFPFQMLTSKLSLRSVGDVTSYMILSVLSS